RQLRPQSTWARPEFRLHGRAGAAHRGALPGRDRGVTEIVRGGRTGARTRRKLVRAGKRIRIREAFAAATPTATAPAPCKTHHHQCKGGSAPLAPEYAL